MGSNFRIKCGVGLILRSSDRNELLQLFGFRARSTVCDTITFFNENVHTSYGKSKYEPQKKKVRTCMR